MSICIGRYGFSGPEDLPAHTGSASLASALDLDGRGVYLILAGAPA